MNDRGNVARRRFLAALGLVSTAALAPGVTMMAVARSPDEAVTDKRRWGLLIDANKCADGCSACVQACNDEHGIAAHEGSATAAQWIRKITVAHRSNGFVQSFPIMCQHCAQPPCVDVCPTGASFKRADGIVLVDKHTCIGCRYCMMACPYNARSFIHETLRDQLPHAPRGKGTVESCTLCVHRIDGSDHAVTACAQACANTGHKAIVFGDLNDPASEISESLTTQGGQQIRADLGLDTGVRYQGLQV